MPLNEASITIACCDIVPDFYLLVSETLQH